MEDKRNARLHHNLAHNHDRFRGGEGQIERRDYRPSKEMLTVIDTGWDFGDACVQIAGYPIRVFPPSGVMQIVAYESVNVEVLTRLASP